MLEQAQLVAAASDKDDLLDEDKARPPHCFCFTLLFYSTMRRPPYCFTPLLGNKGFARTRCARPHIPHPHVPTRISPPHLPTHTRQPASHHLCRKVPHYPNSYTTKFLP